jgi:hypothetical protein
MKMNIAVVLLLGTGLTLGTATASWAQGGGAGGAAGGTGGSAGMSSGGS